MSKVFLKGLHIYGGSFDPAHEGHYDLIKSLRDKFPDDLIVVAPTLQNPHKELEPVPLAIRIEMLGMICDQYGLDYEVWNPTKPKNLYPKRRKGVVILHDRYVLASDLILRMRCAFDTEISFSGAVEKGQSLKKQTKSWEAWEAAGKVKYDDIEIITQVHSSMVRKGEHPLHPAISDFALSRNLYPKASS